jgi:hypothetical protein
MTDHSQTIQEFAYRAAIARYQDILAAAIGAFGAVVQSGPFAGMTLSMRASWGHGDMLPKLLGYYEQELHESLVDIVSAQPDLVINVGAAEGYYAVGLARLLQEPAIHAFDTSELAQDICREAARLNGVEQRVSVAGHCTPDLLQLLLMRGRRPLVVCDCEGGEMGLIDPSRAPALASATLLIECHDFLVSGCTQTLVDRLAATHEMYIVRESGRDPNASPFLQHFSSLDRWIAVCEFRPSMMHWLIAKPKPGLGA